MRKRPRPCQFLLLVVIVCVGLGSLVLCTVVSHVCCVVWYCGNTEGTESRAAKQGSSSKWT